MLPLQALDDLAQRCDILRRQASSADAQSLNQSQLVREAAATTKAGVYVWLAAALEEFVRQELSLLMAEVASVNPAYVDLKPSVLAVVLKPAIDSLMDMRGLKLWNRSAELLKRTTDGAVAPVAGAAHPLDGRTLKERHFQTVWDVLGLPGRPVPSPRHALALKELARVRNELAHGSLDPIVFGRSKAMADVLRTVGAVEDLGQHLHLAAETYLAGRGYLR